MLRCLIASFEGMKNFFTNALEEMPRKTERARWRYFQTLFSTARIICIPTHSMQWQLPVLKENTIETYFIMRRASTRNGFRSYFLDLAQSQSISVMLSSWTRYDRQTVCLSSPLLPFNRLCRHARHAVPPSVPLHGFSSASRFGVGTIHQDRASGFDGQLVIEFVNCIVIIDRDWSINLDDIEGFVEI